MRRIHGDLLMGGAAIRELDGTLDDNVGCCGQMEGRFVVELGAEAQLELSRPYLFIFDNGDSVELVVKQIDSSSHPGRLVVQFECTS